MKNKLTSFLLSVAVAFGLWLYVTTTVSQEATLTIYNIPVVMEGESILSERNLMITAESNRDVDLTLSGKRSDLIKVNSNNITLKVDLTKIYEAGSKIPLNYSITYPGDVASNAFVVENKNPGNIHVTVEERRTKDVPVTVKWVGSSPSGFMSDRENRVLDYDSVSVVGPASVADQITQAVIEVDLSEQKESISQNFRYTLCDQEGNPVDAQLITTNVEEIHLDVKIQMVKEVKLKLDVIYGGGANAGNTQITLEPATIRLSGGEAVLAELGDTINLGKIDLNVLEKSQSITFPIALPEGVTNLSNITEAKATIQFNNLGVKEFVVTNIRAVNVPEGMQVDLITEKLTVTFRGAPGDLSRMVPEDVEIIVDFAEADEGTTTFKPQIQWSEDFKSIGPVGTYSISATLEAQ